MRRQEGILTEGCPPVQILHVHHSGILGGSTGMVYHLATHFNEGPWRSVVLCADDGPLLTDLRQVGVHVIPMAINSKARALARIPAMALEIRARCPDIVHVHSQFAGFAGGIAARLAGHSKVVYKAAFPSFWTDFDPWRRLRNHIVEKISCLCSRHVVCVSQHDLSEFRRRRLVSIDQSSVIYSGVEPERFSPCAVGREAGTLRPRNARHVIAFVGRLTNQKGVDVLLRAMSIVRTAVPDCALLVAGDGPWMPRLRQLAQSLGMGEAVTFLGPRRDVPAILQASDVLAVPSLFEPLGIVAIEGMAAGKPVVASRVGGLQEIVSDGETGLLVSPGDPVDLAKAIEAVLGDPERARAMGRAGIHRASEIFSIQRMLAAYEKLYRGLLSDKRGGRAVAPVPRVPGAGAGEAHA